LLFALFTGLRRNEILTLKWGDINIESEYFCVTDTKNGLDLELPITPVLKTIFEEQLKRSISPYVFGADNSFGQVREPKKVINKIKAHCQSACSFHDLRRTFATTAENLDIGTYKLKRLLNHASGRDDVTAGYVILTAETLRKPAIKIQNEINLQGKQL
jgi:integrase